MSPNIPSFATKARQSIGRILQRILIEESQLAASTQQYVWRVRGSPLQSVKRLFGEQQRQIERWVGELGACAERVGLAGKVAAAADGADAARATLPAIVAQHEAIAAELRQVVEELRERDPNNDALLVLGGLQDFHETSAWMLRLILQSPDSRRMG